MRAIFKLYQEVYEVYRVEMIDLLRFIRSQVEVCKEQLEKTEREIEQEQDTTKRCVLIGCRAMLRAVLEANERKLNEYRKEVEAL
jgi:deoxyadenosine/deoxycytidine kinase